MLIALLAERAFSPHRDAALARPAARSAVAGVPGLAARSAALAVLLILLPALAVHFVREALGLPLLRLAFDALVLFACLGPRDLADDLRRLRSARAQGDAERAKRVSAELQHGPEADPAHRSLLGALFIQSHERLFGVLWWFLAAGPAGAILYRAARSLAAALEDSATPGARAAATLHALLAWLPARLTAALFALAGSMDDAVGEWRRLAHAPQGDWRHRTWNLLAEVSAASLDWEEGERGGPAINASLDAVLVEVQRMQLRALLILLAITALSGVGNWIA